MHSTERSRGHRQCNGKIILYFVLFAHGHKGEKEIAFICGISGVFWEAKIELVKARHQIFGI